MMTQELSIMATDMRNKVDNIKDMVYDIHEAINDLMSDYVIASKLSEEEEEMEFSEFYIGDCFDLVCKLEDLDVQIENMELLK